jgi:ketosteroid isomerase-like protein
VSFRILHVFQFRDGKICRENVWCDLAAIQQQLGCQVV